MIAKGVRRLDTSMTRAVTLALKDKLAETEVAAVVRRRTQRLLAGANAIAGRLTAEQIAMDLNAELYDADGLPR